MIYIIKLFLHSWVWAETVLLPNINSQPAEYFNKCRQSGYICAEDFVMNQFDQKETPQFHQLIEELDLLQTEQRAELSPKINLILKQEMLSLEQLDFLIDLLKKSNELEARKDNQLLLKTLTKIHSMLSHQIISTESESIVLFKKRISRKYFDKNFHFFKDYKYLILHFNSYQENGVVYPFVSANCPQVQTSPLIDSMLKDQIYLVFEKESCSAFESAAQMNTHLQNWVSDHQQPLLWSVTAGVLIYLFQSKYEIEFK